MANRFGDGLVALLMLAMGLGCLNLAFQGLLDGSVGGAKGVAFALAAQPIKFVLIEFFWVGLGLVLLLAAWRGASPQTADEDGEQGHGCGTTQAVRPSMEPLSAATGVSAGASTGVATGVATGASSARSAHAEPPAPLALYPSRFYAVMSLVLSSLLAAGMAFTVGMLTSRLGGVWVVLALAPIALIHVITAVRCWRDFFANEPTLVLDEFGITHHRKGGRLIPWTEVEAVRLHVEKASTYLMLRFRHPSDVRVHFGRLRGLQSIGRHAFYAGFEGRVKLTALSFTRATVLQKAQAFLRYSRR